MPWERDVLVAARAGVTVADIARALVLSEGTVRDYLSAAIARTGTRDRAEAARVADERGTLSEIGARVRRYRERCPGCERTP